ncbi:hypothetical protein HGRIS_000121 [Hohenbuehelia grisea]|uniref:SET domain-containing protein n=1 Tax=Hohenbuehelia grisea TaxID=104357 RepID=A0ABR3JRZ0_9AGAR
MASPSSSRPQRSPSAPTRDVTDAVAIDPELLQTGIDTFKHVFGDFFAWNSVEAQSALSGLSPRSPDLPADILLELSDTSPLDPATYGVNRTTKDSGTVCKIYTFGDDQGNSAPIESSISPITVDLVSRKEKLLTPYPDYLSCVPSNRSMIHRDGEEFDFYHFLPFIDDSEFRVEEYMALLDDLPWQTNMEDPFLLSVQLETLRRLHYGHNLEFAQIDQLGILPPCSSLWKKLYQSNTYSLSNDFMDDPEDSFPLPQLLSSNLGLQPFKSTIPASQIDKQVNHILDSFCPLPGCLRLNCGTHDHFKAPIAPQVATVESYMLADQPPEAACGRGCFLKSKVCHASEDFLKQFEWENDSEIQALDSLLKIMPDEKPCCIAVILRKPCWEVFLHRRLILPDSQIADAANELEFPRNVGRVEIKNYVDTPEGDQAMLYKMLPPCNHAGPCDTVSGCECFRNSQHCQRNCYCSSSCNIRWKGCRCNGSARKSRKNLCRTKSCACFAVNRECDPELCLKCGVKEQWADYCQNAQLQNGQTAIVEVKPAEFGLGAFAFKYMPAYTLLGEYTGEMNRVIDDDHGSRSFSKTERLKTLVMDFTGRNYIFSLGKQWTIDALYLGNETRFLNDTEKNKHNCTAREMNVNGERKIGIYTQTAIKAKSELTLDYGKDYWGEGSAGEQEGAEQGTAPDRAKTDSSEEDTYSPNDESSDQSYKDT